MTRALALLLLILSTGMAKSKEKRVEAIAPVASKKIKKFLNFGELREDPYFWLKNKRSDEVKNYLEAENTYASQVLEPVQKLQAEFVKELKSRVNQVDSSYPYKDGDYYYYIRFEAGSEYPIYARKKGSREAKEEILLNVNLEAAKEKSSYYSSFITDVAANHEFLVIATDKAGRNFYDLRIVEIKTGKQLLPAIKRVTGDAVLSEDLKHLFYTSQDAETLRANKVWRLNLISGKTELLLEEQDEAFSVDLGQTRTRNFITLEISASQEDETWLVDSRNSASAPKLFLRRQKNHEYDVEDGGDRFFILSNKQAKNFQVFECGLDNTQFKNWKVIVPERNDVLIEDLDVFKDYFVLSERSDGLVSLNVYDRKTLKSKSIKFPEKTYSLSPFVNEAFDGTEFLFSYESLLRPPSVFSYDIKSAKTKILKVKDIPNFNPENYQSARVFVTVRDGTKVPVSLLYRKDFKRRKSSPLLLSGYGAYGLSSDASFTSYPLSFVDKGFVYAIAHVRGGSEMGRSWYDQGRLHNKLNTFYDFIDVAEELIRLGFASRGHVYAEGASAGGLLMGAIANLRPDLFRALSADVPFVDVLTTMFDKNIPLTVGEYEEWGNPNIKADYQYMRKYSPYDNVKAQAYPHMLITGALEDSQVQYWEPAKWTAKLRTYNTGPSKILLYTDMNAGHSGKSGRFEALGDAARTLAFFVGIEAGLLK